MLAGMLAGLRLRAKLATRRAAFGAVGGVFLIVGVACLSVSLWIVTAALAGAAVAALVVGLIYLGLGFVVIAIGRRPVVPAAPAAALPPPAAHHRTVPPTLMAGSVPGMIEAFLFGLGAGRAFKGRR